MAGLEYVCSSVTWTILPPLAINRPVSAIGMSWIVPELEAAVAVVPAQRTSSGKAIAFRVGGRPGRPRARRSGIAQGAEKHHDPTSISMVVAGASVFLAAGVGFFIAGLVVT